VSITDGAASGGNLNGVVVVVAGDGDTGLAGSTVAGGRGGTTGAGIVAAKVIIGEARHVDGGGGGGGLDVWDGDERIETMDAIVRNGTDKGSQDNQSRRMRMKETRSNGGARKMVLFNKKKKL
jgi:hypothetical protein